MFSEKEDYSNDKKVIYEKCLQWSEAKLSMGQETLDQLNASLEMETKSSMGDKYETSREIIQQEKNKISMQIQQAMQFKNLLLRLDPNHKCNQVENGSMVISSEGIFYISAPIGKLLLDKNGNNEVFAISLQSPIGQALNHKKVGESIEFQGRRIDILEIC